jgi:hypothetical protein
MIHTLPVQKERKTKIHARRGDEREERKKPKTKQTLAAGYLSTENALEKRKCTK